MDAERQRDVELAVGGGGPFAQSAHVVEHVAAVNDLHPARRPCRHPVHQRHDRDGEHQRRVRATADEDIVACDGTGVIDLRYIVIGHISVARSLGSAPAPYCGTDTLPTPYRVYVPSALNSSMPALPGAPVHAFGLDTFDSHRGRIISQERWLAGSVNEQTMLLRTTTLTNTQLLNVPALRAEAATDGSRRSSTCT